MASTELRTAAQQALEALEGGADSWQLVGPAIDALKEALVEDAMQKFTDVNQELEAALAETQTWVCPDSAEHRYGKPGHCEDCGKTLVQVAEPMQEGWVHAVVYHQHPAQRSRAKRSKPAASVKRGSVVWVTSAEPVQEPVAWIDDSGHPKHLSHLQSATERRLYGPLRPLYTTPPPAEPVQEQPVCDECGKHKRDGWALYCVKCVEPMFARPQRKPLTLTDEVIAELWHKNGGFHHHFARAIERWLRGHA